MVAVHIVQYFKLLLSGIGMILSNKGGWPMFTIQPYTYSDYLGRHPIPTPYTGQAVSGFYRSGCG